MRGGMRLRGRIVRLLPPRREPFPARKGPNVRGCSGGYRLAELGVFPAGGGCPVPHSEGNPAVAERAAARAAD
ncbi:hypothetical protein ABH931_005925 [Streptacidiphilus sp. MAP12-33]|uniref:hypothetical protein n=1 Tax=Streptacidiphilus sp. MAP12-33 TaxID=3156266 RepID=UPI003511C61F